MLVLNLAYQLWPQMESQEAPSAAIKQLQVAEGKSWHFACSNVILFVMHVVAA
jgi:hypothetical protein